MSTERGHGKDLWNPANVLFLRWCEPLKMSLNGIFPTHTPKLCFYQAVPFFKIFPWFTYLMQKKIWSFFRGSTRPSKPGPLHVVHQPQKTQGGMCCRPTLHRVFTLNTLLSAVIRTHSLTSFRCLCKRLPSEIPAYHCYPRTLLFFFTPQSETCYATLSYGSLH